MELLSGNQAIECKINCNYRDALDPDVWDCGRNAGTPDGTPEIKIILAIVILYNTRYLAVRHKMEREAEFTNGNYYSLRIMIIRLPSSSGSSRSSSSS